MADLKHFQEFKTVRILLPMAGAPPLPLDCVAHSENPPFIDAFFIDGQLPVDGLDEEGECQISFEAGGQAHAFKARIDKIVSSEKLRLQTIQSFSKGQQREFFRIDVELTLKYRRLSEGEEGSARRIKGRINLSGGGLWFPTQEELEPKEKLSVELFLPGSPPTVAFALAEVIRMTGADAASRGAAVKFDEIDAVDRDEIVAFCFQEQRRQLRNRIKIEDSL